MMDLINKLSIASGLSTDYLINIISRANKSYLKRYVKINGKERLFFVPSEEIKYIQHLIIDLYLSKIPISQNSHAYTKGKSIKTNALAHIDNTHFFQTDIVSFFPSISDVMIKNCILDFKKENFGVIDLSTEAIDLLVNIVAPFGRLDLGSPSSPIISNIIMRQFDNQINIKLNELLSNPIYTRYSDDITISSDNTFDPEYLFKEIRELLNIHGFKINENKTKFSENKSNIKITGIFLNKNKVLSVGTKFKKKLKQHLYEITKNKPTKEEAMMINGMLSFIKDIEPDYHTKLILKYSSQGQSIYEYLKNVIDEN